ncbi:MAG: hypothetical protein JWQ97_1003 [Phenylobacterium sp.]|nr:hypothetical protein [Phenylobacterium sp.]
MSELSGISGWLRLSLAGASHLPVVKLSTRYIPFSIDLADIRWSGDWSVLDGELCVGSAYGCAKRPLGRRKPDLLARDMLVEILCARLVQCEERRAHA